MREILFQGIRRDNGEWIEGGIAQNYFVDGDICIISDRGEIVSVDPATVGQYIGIPDKNGKKIFEGNIVRYKDRVGVVRYWSAGFAIHFAGAEAPEIGLLCNWLRGYIEVIGNSADRPGLKED